MIPEERKDVLIVMVVFPILFYLISFILVVYRVISLNTAATIYGILTIYLAAVVCIFCIASYGERYC